MKRLNVLLILSAVWFSSSAQFMPGDPGFFLDPIKPPLNFPDHGFQLFAKLSDSMIIQSPLPPNDWKDSVRIDIAKNPKKDVTHFASKQSVGGVWTAQAEYIMSYQYNLNDQVSVFRRSLGTADFEIVNHFSYTYGSASEITKATILDSIYLKAQTLWVVTPAQESYNYNAKGQLEEKLFSKASTGQTTLENEKKWTYSYDANGNCIQLTEYLWDESASSWDTDQRYLYTYNSNDEMTKATASFWNGTGWEKEDAEISFTYTNGQLSRVEEVNQDGQDDDDATDYFYTSKGVIDYFDSQEKPYGTSTWNKTRRTQVFSDAKGNAEFAYVYFWTGSTYEKAPSERILFRSISTSRPKAPSGLTVSTSKKAGEKLYLNWTDNSNDETGFIIYRSTDSLKFDSIGNVVENITAFTDSSLATNTKYFYRVAAYNSAGLSQFSNTVGETTLTSGISTANGEGAWMYPNPVLDICTLQMPEPITCIKIYDLSGQLQMIEHPKSDSVQMDLSALNAGYYWISCSTTTYLLSRKIIKL